MLIIFFSISLGFNYCQNMIFMGDSQKVDERLLNIWPIFAEEEAGLKPDWLLKTVPMAFKNLLHMHFKVQL